MGALSWLMDLDFAAGTVVNPTAPVSRWASTLNATAAAQPALAMVTLADLNFSDGTIRLHDAWGTLSFGGNTYTGIGTYGSVDVVDESTETIAKPITLKLSAEPGTLLTEAMTQNYQGRKLTLYVGLVDVNSGQFIDTPEIVWEGRMDYMTTVVEQGKTSLEMRCEHRLNREPLVARMTDVDQQLAFPGDTFFDLLWMIPFATAGWGNTSVQYPANQPPPGRSGTPIRGGGGGGGKPP